MCYENIYIYIVEFERERFDKVEIGVKEGAREEKGGKRVENKVKVVIVWNLN